MTKMVSVESGGACCLRQGGAERGGAVLSHSRFVLLDFDNIKSSKQIDKINDRKELSQPLITNDVLASCDCYSRRKFVAPYDYALIFTGPPSMIT